MISTLTATTAVLLILAVYRITTIISQEAIFDPARQWARARGGKLSLLASCPLCISVWAGFLVAGLWSTGSLVAHIPLVGFAASQGFILLDRAWARLNVTTSIPVNFAQQTVEQVEALKTRLAVLEQQSVDVVTTGNGNAHD